MNNSERRSKAKIKVGTFLIVRASGIQNNEILPDMRPAKVHTLYDSAFMEAVRLANLHDDTFLIFRAVSSAMPKAQYEVAKAERQARANPPKPVRRRVSKEAAKEVLNARKETDKDGK